MVALSLVSLRPEAEGHQVLPMSAPEKRDHLLLKRHELLVRGECFHGAINSAIAFVVTPEMDELVLVTNKDLKRDRE